jgi:hypothetical protein
MKDGKDFTAKTRRKGRRRNRILLFSRTQISADGLGEKKVHATAQRVPREGEEKIRLG